jgi:hypothetical protein
MLRRKLKLALYFMGCFSLLSQSLEAQQGNQWYFGKFAGLNFSANPPASVLDGQTNTLEGTTSIADENGNLLFYTNGEIVLNRNHDPMPNGTGLKGNVSSFQNAVIVPQPGNNNIYYLFTSDAIENDGKNGYNYSIIDMTRDNGLGDITIKNTLLYGPSSERITSIKGADFKSYWSSPMNGTAIFSEHIKLISGLNPTPVVSTVGRVLNQNVYSNIGVLRVSANGKLLLQTNVHGRPETPATNEFFQIFDFDNNTGQITNSREIPLLNDGYYWGGEFSPCKCKHLVNPFSKSIHQFDVSLNITTILTDQTNSAVTEEPLLASHGTRSKIYVATGGMSACSDQSSE